MGDVIEFPKKETRDVPNLPVEAEVPKVSNAEVASAEKDVRGRLSVGETVTGHQGLQLVRENGEVLEGVRTKDYELPLSTKHRGLRVIDQDIREDELGVYEDIVKDKETKLDNPKKVSEDAKVEMGKSREKVEEQLILKEVLQHFFYAFRAKTNGGEIAVIQHPDKLEALYSDPLKGGVKGVKFDADRTLAIGVDAKGNLEALLNGGLDIPTIGLDGTKMLGKIKFFKRERENFLKENHIGTSTILEVGGKKFEIDFIFAKNADKVESKDKIVDTKNEEESLQKAA